MSAEAGSIVARIRKELGLSQSDIASKLDRSQAQVSYAEKGANEQFLRKIARYLVQEYGEEYGYKMSDIFPDEKTENEAIMEELINIRQAIEELKQKLEKE